MTTLDDAAERRIRQLRDQIFAYVTKPDDGRLFEPLTLIESVLRTVHEDATEAAALKCEDQRRRLDARYNSACDHCAAAIRGKDR